MAKPDPTLPPVPAVETYDGLSPAKYARPRRADFRDRPGGKHEFCLLFTFDLTHDGAARTAVALYADLIEPVQPRLARDLRWLLRDATTPDSTPRHPPPLDHP